MKAALSSELKEPALGRSGWESVPGRGSSKHEVPEVERSWGTFKELTKAPGAEAGVPIPQELRKSRSGVEIWF